MNLKEKLNEDISLVEKELEKYLVTKNQNFPGLFEAMRYTTLAGGKRIRAFLVLEFCRFCGGNPEDALPYACAVEMIHAYSLIHDDLPCMDNDSMRRGKPSNHIVYGEAPALLAGDGLLTYAFEVCSGNEKTDGTRNAKAVNVLSNLAGPCGMVGGQSLDLIGETRKLSLEELLEVDRLKTGALIVASCVLGCIAAGKFDMTDTAKEYAKNIGLVFQIIDDILDETSDEKTLGKPIGSDKEQNKTTFLSYYSIEKAKEFAKEYTEKAKSVLKNKGDSSVLEELADYLFLRNK